jgi:glycosyltransferase involved in cell wall biosynthesis
MRASYAGPGVSRRPRFSCLHAGTSARVIMLISIVIPCYNAESTIADTIESALSQDVEREIIVINDGSTDRSAQIIASFANHIRIEDGPNRGVSTARNKGGELARGAFLQYLDSDDLLAPGTLGQRLDLLLSSGADAAYTDWQKLVETPDHCFALGDVMFPEVALLEEDAEAACADSRFWVPPAAILYRRNIVDRAGGWRSDFPIVEDAHFLFSVATHNARFVHVPGVGAFYRVRANSLSRQSRAKFIHYCFMNAQEIEVSWRGRNALTAARVEVLRSMWQHAAIAALVEASPDFEVARHKHNGVGRRRFAIEAGWILRRVLGPKGASAIARSELERRAVRINRRPGWS